MLQLLGEDAAKTTHFAAFLQEVFQPNTDALTMEVAAGVLGHLVHSGGALTADIVEVEVRTLGGAVHVCRCLRRTPKHACATGAARDRVAGRPRGGEALRGGADSARAGGERARRVQRARARLHRRHLARPARRQAARP